MGTIVINSPQLKSLLTKPLLGLSNKGKIATTEKRNIQITAQILKYQA